MERPTILFYSVAGEHGFMSSFAPASLRLKGHAWRTTEQYVQAQKLAGSPDEREARDPKTPMIAARLGRDREGDHR